MVYRDDVIKVDNIYSYENSKDKEMIFHLRVLIKALLEEMDRIRNKHNLDLALDEGIMELLRKQAIDGLDVDAIIGLFRPLPKVV